jgi:hypothetical protein
MPTIILASAVARRIKTSTCDYHSRNMLGPQRRARLAAIPSWRIFL